MKKNTSALDLPHSQLRSLIASWQKSNLREQKRMERIVKRELGDGNTKEDPGIMAFLGMLLKWTSDVIARRLKEDHDSGELYLPEDREFIFKKIKDEMCLTLNISPESEEAASVAVFLRQVVDAFIAQMGKAISGTESPREKLLRMIDITVTTAAARGVTPIRLIGSQAGRDAVIRKLYTKKQYEDQNNQALESFLNPDFIAQAVVAPIVQFASAGEDPDISGEEDAEIKAELRAEMEPKLLKIKLITQRVMEKDVRRIYDAA